MPIRSQHFTAARRLVEEATSLADLAKLEIEERHGDNPRDSVKDAIGERARVLAEAATEDDKLEALEILDGISDSIISAALEGDSQGDDVEPGSDLDGGASPSVAAVLKVAKSERSTRVVGRLVRVRNQDGSITTRGFAELVR